MIRRSVLTVTLAGAFLHGTPHASARQGDGQSPTTETFRDYRREADARGINIEAYLYQLSIEEQRRQFTHGVERPAEGDYPPTWEAGYQSGLRGDSPGYLRKRSASWRKGYEAGARQARRN